MGGKKRKVNSVCRKIQLGTWNKPKTVALIQRGWAPPLRLHGKAHVTEKFRTLLVIQVGKVSCLAAERPLSELGRCSRAASS